MIKKICLIIFLGTARTGLLGMNRANPTPLRPSPIDSVIRFGAGMGLAVGGISAAKLGLQIVPPIIQAIPQHPVTAMCVAGCAASATTYLFWPDIKAGFRYAGRRIYYALATSRQHYKELFAGIIAACGFYEFYRVTHP